MIPLALRTFMNIHEFEGVGCFCIWCGTSAQDVEDGNSLTDCPGPSAKPVVTIIDDPHNGRELTPEHRQAMIDWYEKLTARTKTAPEGAALKGETV